MKAASVGYRYARSLQALERRELSGDLLPRIPPVLPLTDLFRRRGVLRLCSASRTLRATAMAAHWVRQPSLNGAIVRGLSFLCVVPVFAGVGRVLVLGREVVRPMCASCIPQLVWWIWTATEGSDADCSYWMAQCLSCTRGMQFSWCHGWSPSADCELAL